MSNNTRRITRRSFNVDAEPTCGATQQFGTDHGIVTRQCILSAGHERRHRYGLDHMLSGIGTDANVAPTGSELARARQTGRTVKELRDEQQRMDAAQVLQDLLDQDKDEARELSGGADTLESGARRAIGLLSTEQRHALHVAVGTLRKQVR